MFNKMMTRMTGGQPVVAVAMLAVALLPAGLRPAAAQDAPPTARAAPATPAEHAAAVARVVARLEPEIQRALLDGNIPSLAVALTDGRDELWSGAYGQSNLWARTPAASRTVYLIGSTFKAQSTVALLQQMEAGHFRLDDPVRDHLEGLAIRGEDPDRPVTFRHLLTHTSGLPTSFGPHLVWGETVPPPLEDYLADSLAVSRPPGETVEYANIAYALVAWLVERFSGMDYKEYVRERVWGPLGMASTAFSPTPDMQERLAVPYVPDEETGRNTPTVRLKANVWPAGIVYGTVHDQARWVRFNLGDGAFEGERLLEPATLDEMHTLQFPEHAGEPLAGSWGYQDPGYGLTWWTTHRNEERFFGHSGSVPGYTAFVMGNRSRGLGVAFLTNGHAAHPHLVRLSNLALDLMAEELGASREPAPADTP